MKKEKVDQTSDTNQKIEALKQRKSQGAAEGCRRADRAEAWGSVSSRVLIWHAWLTERGRRIYGLPPLPPTAPSPQKDVRLN